ncbi:MAG: acetyl-CoA carboxylase carboxyl transferase subunit beta, partial [Chloroflexaceae bacterium]|nr:acetyl-CoA carboxylase carboxyl transferase subunit beta [Chloroflexaceae bacterium]
GMIDLVVPRNELRDVLARLLRHYDRRRQTERLPASEAPAYANGRP